MKKALMLTSPHMSIRKSEPFPPLSYGTAEICGALKNEGYDIYYYDLNAALSNIRGSYELTESDDLILRTIPALLFINHESTREGDSIFSKWMDKLIKIIDVQDYEFIGISLDDRYVLDPDSIYRSDVFNFALLLSYKLKDTFPKSKIYMGGKAALDVVPKENFTRSTMSFNLPINAIFMSESKDIFPQYLKRNDGYAETETHVIYKRRNTSSPQYLQNVINTLEIPPYWNIKNKSDIMWDIKSAIPDVIKEEFPVLNEISPFTIVSYSFTDGCKFKCSFCPCRGGSYRSISVKSVVDAIESIYDQGYDSFAFYNSSINANMKYIVSICNEIIKRNIKIKFSDSATLNHMTTEVTNALSESGCIKLWFGGESGSNRLLELNRKYIALEKMHEKLELSHKAGIWNAINLIISFPNETDDDFTQTYNLSRHKYVDCFRANNFNLYPFTEYVSNPNRFGVKLRNLTWIPKNKREAYTYDDLSSTWEEKVVQRHEKLEKMYEGTVKIENLFKESDELLFGISQVMKEKEMKRDFFKTLFSNLDKKEFRNILFVKKERI